MYWQALLAYLTGWPIVQLLYARIRKRMARREMENPSEETVTWFDAQAKAIVDEMERRETERARQAELDMERFAR